MDREKIYEQTKLISSGDKDGIKDCASHIASGEVVAFPTETVYGLGANALDASAVNKIFAAKGRPSDNPLICHIGSKSQIKDIVSEVTPLAQVLIDNFMPGPITVIMNKNESIPSEVTAGLGTVGVRMPSDPTANAFLKACKVPVAAPSANLSGSPSPTNARSVMEDMDGYVYAVIDGGDSVFGLESTVVDATGEAPVILRPGAVTKADIDRAVAVARSDDGTSSAAQATYASSLEDGETPKAPGMKYRHYAPFAQVEIMKMPENAVIINDEALFDFDSSEPAESSAKSGKTEASDTSDATESEASESGEIDFTKMTDDEKQALVDIFHPYIAREKELLAKSPFTRVGILAGREIKALFEKLGDKILTAHTEFYTYGDALDVKAASHALFEGLRHLDCQEVDVILAQGFNGTGLSEAYMNRLEKAAGNKGALVPGMPAPSRPKRKELPLEAFKDTYTAQILFVDDDNTCLSQACEAVMNDLITKNSPYCTLISRDIGCEIYCESAGLCANSGAKCDQGIVDAYASLSDGRSISYLRSAQADPATYDESDIIITVRDEQAFEIAKAFPEIKDKVCSMSSFAASNGLVMRDSDGKLLSISIPDPRGENEATYLHTVKALKAWLEILFPYIIKRIGAQRI